MQGSLLHAQALAGAPSAPALGAGGHTLVRENIDNVGLVQGALEEFGVPLGLARLVAQEDHRIGLRVYLLDNSGSTSTWDGTVFVEDPDSRRSRLKTATRWEEIRDVAKDHARWNLQVGTPCEFVLLNSTYRLPEGPIVEGRDSLRIDPALGPMGDQLQRLDNFLANNGPHGVTPLAERLDDIGQLIGESLQALSARGQLVFVVIVTDGMPTTRCSGESTPEDRVRLVDSMKRIFLMGPVRMVIRLCTNDAQTVKFYSSLDDEQELELDVLNDYRGEAEEIASKGNDWFAYTPRLHLIREAGTLCKILDDLDEGLLPVGAVRLLASMLLESREQPLDGIGDVELVREAGRVARDHRRLVFDAHSMASRPPVNARRLRRALGLGVGAMLKSTLCPCVT